MKIPRATRHAQKRSVERYGGELHEARMHKIAEDILLNRAVYLHEGKEPHQAIFAVLLDDKAVPVVYDKRRKTVITIYPRRSMLTLLNKRLRKLCGIPEAVTGSAHNREQVGSTPTPAT